MKKIFAFFFVLLLITTFNNAFAQKADSLFNFIRSHSKNASFYLTMNDRKVNELNGEKLMPLANTMQLMIGIEFSRKAGAGQINPSSLVPVSEVEKYYLPGLDNGYTKWSAKAKETGEINQQGVSLLSIAKGMMQYGCNANSEYLLDLLGIQNVNDNYKLMSIKDFTPIFYPVSSYFLYQNPKKKNEKMIIKNIEMFNDHDYGVAISFIHDQLKNNPKYKGTFRPQDLSLRFQKEWNDRLPKSSAKSYTYIAQVLNNRFIFGKEAYAILTQIIEEPIKKELDKYGVTYAGVKEGATPFAYTHTIYATMDNGNKYCFSYFLNNLNKIEVDQLESWSKEFDISTITGTQFFQKLMTTKF